MFTDKPVVLAIQTSMVELLIQYIQDHSPLAADCNHNWKVKT